MKNEQKFKQRIAEVAAKIAGIKEYDSNKMELPSGVLTRLNSSISTYADLAMAIEDIIGEIIKAEPSMKDLENKSGWNVIFQKLDQLSGNKKAEDEKVPAVDASTEKELGLPLQEAFNRINRK
jgi:hypothetical protein